MSAATLRHRAGPGASASGPSLDLVGAVRIVDKDDSSESSDSASDEDDSHLPTWTPPTFTIKELLGVIPKHCFQRSAIKSSLYILQDVVFIAAIAYAASFINPALGARGSLVDGHAGRALRYLAWAVYAYVVALPGTGLWVIAHECGHQGFSESKTINNAVGWVLHSALLVPYHSWRISHAKHHAATGHMTRDQVFVPKTRSQCGVPSRTELAKRKASAALEAADELFEDAPLWVLANVFAQQVFGWPMYLINNASGQNFGRRTNHFEPSSPIFDKRHFMQIVMSDVGLAIAFGVLGFWGSQRGFLEVFRYYLGPYLWVNSNLVMITFLQHTDAHMPHYRAPEWNFQRGALCTIDRSYFGFFLHGICETHVAHHLCSAIPHYNAWEATEALKEKLGSYYLYDDRNLFLTLFRNYRDCRFVEDEGDVLFYKNSQGKAQLRVAYDTPVSDSGIDMTDEAKASS